MNKWNKSNARKTKIKDIREDGVKLIETTRKRRYYRRESK